jgi:hypothetical protein
MERTDPVYWSMLALFRTLKLSLQRASEIPDPTTRATLMLDKLLVFTDLLQGVGETIIEFSLSTEAKNEEEKQKRNEQITNVKNEMDGTMKLLQNELKMLSKWVQSPVYSPDHAFGHNVMKETEKKFNETFGL